MSPLGHAGLGLLGFGIGAFGTLIGAGGGFLLVPILLLLFPAMSPAGVSTISLAVVLANSAAGSFSYLRLRRADYRSGAVLAAATLPGSVLGALVVNRVPRHAFDLIMASLLVGVSCLLLLQPERRLAALAGAPFTVTRSLRDSDGNLYRYRFNLGLAALLTVGVGFLSSLLGIGGGIVHVPLLTALFDFPPHVATATSHFVLAFMAGAGTATHVVHGDFGGHVASTLALAAGVLVGAPVGAAVSGHIRSRVIMRLLAVALAVVAVRLVVAAF